MILRAAGNELLTRGTGSIGRSLFAKKDIPHLSPLALENPMAFRTAASSPKLDPTIALAGEVCRKLLSGGKTLEEDASAFLRRSFVHNPISFTSTINAQMQIAQRESSINLPPQLFGLALSVALSNGYSRVPLLWNETLGFGLWAYASSINHSCSPNAEYYVDHSGNFHLYSIRPIQSGHEITVSYLPPHTLMMPSEHRIQATRKLGFACRCHRCQSEPKSPLRYASRLPYLSSISEFIAQFGSAGHSFHQRDSPFAPHRRRWNQATALLVAMVDRQVSVPEALRAQCPELPVQVSGLESLSLASPDQSCALATAIITRALAPRPSADAPWVDDLRLIAPKFAPLLQRPALPTAAASLDYYRNSLQHLQSPPFDGSLRQHLLVRASAVAQQLGSLCDSPDDPALLENCMKTPEFTEFAHSLKQFSRCLTPPPNAPPQWIGSQLDHDAPWMSRVIQ